MTYQDSKGVIDVSNLVVGVIGILVGMIGIWLARKQIKNFFRALRPKESIALFGPKEAGKTTLTRYLRYKPVPRRHIETLYTESVGKIVFDLTGDESYFFVSREMWDVGGEFKNQWKVIIRKQNPDGIIYIIDTSKPIEEINGLAAILRIYHELRGEMLARDIRLQCLLVLLNKCDVWGQSQQARERMIEYYKNEVLSDVIAALQREFGDLEIQIGYSSLTDRSYTSHNNEVLRQFAMSLGERGR